jgi:flagellar biogenesis protein FliO
MWEVLFGLAKLALILALIKLIGFWIKKILASFNDVK